MNNRETLQTETDTNLNAMGEIKVFYECKDHGKQKPKEKKQEGDGRKGQSKDSQTGSWGKHQPVRERPADRDKSWKPWKKK